MGNITINEIRDDLGSSTVTLDDGVAYTSALITAELSMEIAITVARIRRAARRADLVESEIKAFEDAGEFEKCDALDEQLRDLDGQAADLSRRLMQLQLVDANGVQPSLETLAKIETQVERRIFEFLVEDGKDEVAEVDPQTPTS